jgi:hypothetical protein
LNNFNFRKMTRRNHFTTIFGGIGKRRVVASLHYPKRIFRRREKFWMERLRRSRIGWRNQVWASLVSLQVRIKYGRRKFMGNFRR